MQQTMTAQQQQQQLQQQQQQMQQQMQQMQQQMQQMAMAAMQMPNAASMMNPYGVAVPMGNPVAVPVCWPMAAMPMPGAGMMCAFPPQLPAAMPMSMPMAYYTAPTGMAGMGAGGIPTIVVPPTLSSAAQQQQPSPATNAATATPATTTMTSGGPTAAPRLPPNPNKRPPRQQQQFLTVPSPKASNAATASDDDGIRNLYVSSLPNEFSTPELLALFSPFGTVLSARYLPPTVINPNAPEHIAYAASDKSSSRGFGFVCFERSEDAVRAMQQMIGRSVGHSKIQVRPSRRHSDGSVVGQFSTSMELSPPPSKNPSTLSRRDATPESEDFGVIAKPPADDLSSIGGMPTPSIGPSSMDASVAVSRSISSIEKLPGGESFSMATLTALMDSIVAVSNGQ